MLEQLRWPNQRFSYTAADNTDEFSLLQALKLGLETRVRVDFVYKTCLHCKRGASFNGKQMNNRGTFSLWLRAERTDYSTSCVELCNMHTVLVPLMMCGIGHWGEILQECRNICVIQAVIVLVYSTGV